MDTAFRRHVRLHITVCFLAVAAPCACATESHEKAGTDAAAPASGGSSGQAGASGSTGEGDASVGEVDAGEGGSGGGGGDGGDGSSDEVVPELPWPEIAPSASAYLILYDDALSESAAELAAYRETTEASVQMLSMSEVEAEHGSADLAEAIELAIEAWAGELDPSQPASVLLLGDAQAVPPRELPGVSSTVGPSITSDNPYADLDGDGIPDLALGRIPALTDQEAGVIIDKIIAHESEYEPGPWNKRINLFASEGGFGAVIDQVIEDIALQIIDPLDNAYDITMTYGSQSSEFVYPPEKLSDKVYERMNEGSFFMAYVGHGYQAGFMPMTWNGVTYPIFDTADLQNLNAEHRLPFLAFIACSNATFDAAEDSIAERILGQPGAPGSVFGSTEISHPYANTVLVREVARNLLETDSPPVTAGELYLRAKQTTISNLDAMRQLIDSLAVGLLGGDDPDVLLEEALQMYVLLGDPAMRLVYPPYRATVTTDKPQYGPRETVAVSIDTGGLGQGTALVTLESARGQFLKPIQPVPADGDPARDSVIEQNYQNANNKVIDFFEQSFTGGSISTVFTLDPSLPAGVAYYVKVLATGTRRDAVGVGSFALVP